MAADHSTPQANGWTPGYEQGTAMPDSSIPMDSSYSLPSYDNGIVDAKPMESESAPMQGVPAEVAPTTPEAPMVAPVVNADSSPAQSSSPQPATETSPSDVDAASTGAVDDEDPFDRAAAAETEDPSASDPALNEQPAMGGLFGDDDDAMEGAIEPTDPASDDLFDDSAAAEAAAAAEPAADDVLGVNESGTSEPAPATELDPATEPVPATQPAMDDLFGGDDAQAPTTDPADNDLFGGDAPTSDSVPAAEPAMDDLFGDPPVNDPANSNDIFGDPPVNAPAANDPVANDPAMDDLFMGEQPPVADPPVADPPAADPPAIEDLFGDPSADGPGTADPAMDDLFGDPPASDSEAPLDDLFGDPPADEAAPAEPAEDVSIDDLFGQVDSNSAPSLEIAEQLTARVDPLAATDIRTWVDDSGQFRTDGRLVSIDVDSVRLAKPNGNFCTVPMSRLSAEDLEYVNTIRSMIQNVKLASLSSN